MSDLLLALPNKYWESPPLRNNLLQEFPAGVPEEFVMISGGGAQNELTIYRMDGATIAIAMGDGENPDYASTINPVGRNFEVLRRGSHGWEEITKKVIPRGFDASTEAILYPGGKLQVVPKDGEGPILNLVYNGKRFVPALE